MKKEKMEKMREMRDGDMTYAEIGEFFGVSRQRIHQALTGYKSPAKHPLYTPELRKMNQEEKIKIYKKRQKQKEEKERELNEKKKRGEIADLSDLTKKFSGRDLIREAIRRRDHYTCQICFRVWKEGERRFDIHHLNGLCGKKSRKYDRAGDISGLITLCHKCHLGLESVKVKMIDGWKKRLRIMNKK